MKDGSYKSTPWYDAVALAAFWLLIVMSGLSVFKPTMQHSALLTLSFVRSSRLIFCVLSIFMTDANPCPAFMVVDACVRPITAN